MERSTRSRISSDHVYTMRQINQHTADVFREINESGEPAVITRRGRIIAIIHPLADSQVESAVIRQVIEGIEHKSQLTGETTLSRATSTEDVATQMGVAVHRYPEREIED